MSEDLSVPGSGYHGRLWDAPMTDGMPKIDMTGATCSLCLELIDEHDDAIRLLSDFHLACLLRSTLGDVYHQLGQCSCFGGDKHDEEGTYREQSERALAAMIASGRGRWADDGVDEEIRSALWEEAVANGEYDERKPELGGAVGRRVTLACAQGEHDLCNGDPACLCRCHE